MEDFNFDSSVNSGVQTVDHLKMSIVDYSVKDSRLINPLKKQKTLSGYTIDEINELEGQLAEATTG